MVYYSPYKQIWRAFIRAIRTFISSLFSKRLLLMIIVALVVMLLHLNVHAESIYQDGYAYRQVSEPIFNNDTNSYDITYRIYNESGLHEGIVKVSQSLYDNYNCMCLFIAKDGSVNLYVNRANPSTCTFYINDLYGSYQDAIISFNKSDWQSTNLDHYTYDFTNETFTLTKSYNSGQYIRYSGNIPSANSFILRKNCDIQYYRKSNQTFANVGSNNFNDNQILACPELKLTSSGFRYYYNDFVGGSSDVAISDNGLSNNFQTLKSIVLFVFDINNNSRVTEDTDFLNYANNHIKIDSDGKIYSDILFEDYLTYMNILDGDYLISIGITLSSKIHPYLPYGDDYHSFDFITNYVSADYWRYTYYANSGAGILRAVYEDGTEKPGQSGSDNSDEPGQDNTANAINNMTNSINGMSDFLQDDNFSSDSILNNMPTSDEFQDVTESGFDNIFTTLRNAFTSDNYQDVEFVVPFSNGQKITIPSNLTENIIPTAIKSLIQMVYWYFIARFIVKDIAGYIEKAKSGDIFSSSDTNIKTDML